MIMKKLIIILLGAIMLFTLAACGSNASGNSGKSQNNEQTNEQNNGQSVGGSTAQIPNPFVDCKTLDDAQKIAGFDMAVPEKMPEGYSQSAIRAIKDTMIEIIYVNGDDEIRIRKGAGSEDISGDYNNYAESDTATVDNKQITMKGDNGKVNVATWVDGAYTYAITTDGLGVDSAVILDMASSIR